MGLKFAHAFGAHVVQFTTSAGKADDAKRLGADEVIVTKDADAVAGHANSFDFILDTGFRASRSELVCRSAEA